MGDSQTALQPYPGRDSISTPRSAPSPLPTSSSSAAPPPAPPSRPSLDKWKEDDDDGDDWGAPPPVQHLRADKGKAKEGGRGKEDEDEAATRKRKALDRAKRAVASESWDDDFDFHAPPPPPRSPHSCKSSHSRSRSRPTTPSYRQVSSSSAYSSSIPPSTPSRSSRGRPSDSPPTSPRGLRVPHGPASMSLDSLASSIQGTSDHDPTLTFDYSATPRPPPPPNLPYRSHHRPTASTSTARPLPPSEQSTPRSRIPRSSHSPSARHSPTTDDDFRSATPSLTEDSLHSLNSSADFPATESDATVGTATEDDTDTEVALAPPLSSSVGTSSGGSMFSGVRSLTGSKKWRFGRGKKEKAKEEQAVEPPAREQTSIFGRRAGPREPEVMLIDRAELDRVGAAARGSPSRLPRPTRPGDERFVVLGQRSRTSAGTTASTATSSSAGSGGSAIPLPAPRVKHSSNTSVSTSTSSGSRSTATSSRAPPPPPLTRPHRTSLQFQPFSFDPSARRGSTASSLSPTSATGAGVSWRQYDGTTSEGDDGETTGADLSEFSGDDDGEAAVSRFPRIRSGKGRGSGGNGHARRWTVTPSTSFTSTSYPPSTRPVSPVESILLGDSTSTADRARWNDSSVSFASTAEAFALRASTGAAGGAEGKKRKLTKKRAGEPTPPSSAASISTFTTDASSRPSSPPLSAKLSKRPGSSGTVQARPASSTRQHRQAPSLPFAQDSDTESAQQHSRRTVRQRSVTSPETQRHSVGHVVEIDDPDSPDWLGVVPFPPTDQRPPPPPQPRLPTSTSRTSLRSPARILRKVSGANKSEKEKPSHPPVTARTQAEAKAAKRGSGLGASLSGILSRSTSALPLGGGVGGGDGGGKRAPSPAPSAKSSKSSRSAMLVRQASARRKKKQAGEAEREDEPPRLPKSPSLGLLKKRSSATVAPPDSSSTSTSSVPPPDPPPKLPHSESAFSFFRARGFSRSQPKPPPPAPPSPVKSAIPRPSAAERSSSSSSAATASRPPPVSRHRQSLTRSRPSDSLAAETAANPSLSRSESTKRGQLNPEFRMPRSTAAVAAGADPRPFSTVSTTSTNGSSASASTSTSTSGASFASTYASTLMPLGGYRDAAVNKAMRSTAGPPIAGLNGSGGGMGPPANAGIAGVGAGGGAGRIRAAQNGHRPSVSLSSIMPFRSASPRPPPLHSASARPLARPADSPPLELHDRPRTALGGYDDHSPSPTHGQYRFDDDLVSESDFGLPRRNSTSDLRIPARITNAQKKIEEDLERVKQFAKGIEDLKTLKRQYDQLMEVFVQPPSLSSDLLSPSSAADRPSATALSKTAQAIRRVELNYSPWWEQAQTLIDLGDGKPSPPSPGARPRPSPGTLASRRDRCVSLVVDATPRKQKQQQVPMLSGSETETDDKPRLAGRAGGLLRSVTNPTGRRATLTRQTSASSIETELSVEARQREMLRGVLAPTSKGASLPSRGPPAPRPGLAVVTGGSFDRRAPSSPTILRHSMLVPDEREKEKTPTRAEPRPRFPLGLSHTISPTATRQARLPVPPTPSRRVSRPGVFGIREFLLRLRSKATAELAASVGTLPLVESPDPSQPSSVTQSPARRSVSDPASRPHTPSASFAANHPRQPLPSALGGRRLSAASSSGSDSGSDWDADLSPPRSSLLFDPSGDAGSSSGSQRGSVLGGEGPFKRGRAQSAMSSSAGAVLDGVGGSGGKDIMVLTSEAMPRLLVKVREVKEKCEACVGLLKGLTV